MFSHCDTQSGSVQPALSVRVSGWLSSSHPCFPLPHPLPPKAVQLKVAEDEIDKKIKQLQDYEQRLKKLMVEYNKEEREKITSLAKLYMNMKPKDAARIFNTLDMSILIPLLKEMKPATTSAILSQMNAERVKEVTAELIGHNY